MRASTKIAVRWTADADGVAHAHAPRGRAPRAVCGIPGIDPRFAHPPSVRCPRCGHALDSYGPTSAITEADLLRGYGFNREEMPIG